MIANERQMQVARADLERFEAALANAREVPAAIDPVVWRAQLQALRAQAEELRRDLEEYHRLRSGDVRSFAIDGLAGLPEGLIRARIASGMTQRGLAERLGLKEQQIQRYEASRYQGASFARIADVADAIGVELPGSIRLADSRSAEALLRRTAVAGLDPAFVRNRLAPDGDPRLVAERLAFVFGWSEEDLLGSAPLELPSAGGASARFKMPRSRNERSAAAYAAYAHRLATICAATGSGHRGPDIPVDAEAMRQLIRERGAIDFANALETAWDLGVVVLPLPDAGQFHGACWRVGWTNVVVLKQGERSAARWLVDLLHELFHAGRFPERPDFELVEDAETSDVRRDDPEERQATWFASLVVTEGRAEELFKSAAARTAGDLRRMKREVYEVAHAAGVDAGALANYAAFRLSLQGENWWGAAANLQDRSVDPLALARDVFFRRFDFSKIDENAYELLRLALHDGVSDG